METAYLLAAMTLLGAGVTLAASMYDFTMDSIQGQPVPLSEYKGKVAPDSPEVTAAIEKALAQ